MNKLTLQAERVYRIFMGAGGMMAQLSLFDQTGLRYRWHLYKDGRLMYTAIPSQDGVTLVGVPKTMRQSEKILRLSHSEYEAHKDIHELEEVK